MFPASAPKGEQAIPEAGGLRRERMEAQSRLGAVGADPGYHGVSGTGTDSESRDLRERDPYKLVYLRRFKPRPC